jgi:hypothetical protein
MNPIRCSDAFPTMLELVIVWIKHQPFPALAKRMIIKNKNSWCWAINQQFGSGARIPQKNVIFWHPLPINEDWKDEWDKEE